MRTESDEEAATASGQRHFSANDINTIVAGPDLQMDRIRGAEFQNARDFLAVHPDEDTEGQLEVSSSDTNLMGASEFASVEVLKVLLIEILFRSRLEGHVIRRSEAVDCSICLPFLSTSYNEVKANNDGGIMIIARNLVCVINIECKRHPSGWPLRRLTRSLLNNSRSVPPLEMHRSPFYRLDQRSGLVPFLTLMYEICERIRHEVLFEGCIV